jgi:hypothetical protein
VSTGWRHRREGALPPAHDPVVDLESTADHLLDDSAGVELDRVAREGLPDGHDPADRQIGGPARDGIAPRVAELGDDEVAGHADGLQIHLDHRSSSSHRRLAPRRPNRNGRPRNVCTPDGRRGSRRHTLSAGERSGRGVRRARPAQADRRRVRVAIGSPGGRGHRRVPAIRLACRLTRVSLPASSPR